MPIIEDGELPDAYLRLLADQRHVPPEEIAEREAEVTREQQANRIRRRLPKAY